MNPLANLSCTLVAGRSGAGKSIFSRRYLRNAQGVAVRLIWDDDGEHARAFGIRPANSVDDLEAGVPMGWVCFDPATLFPGRTEDAFAFWCEWCFEVSRRGPGRKIMLIDEAWRYCQPSFIPAELARVVQTGRKWELETVFATQRPQRLNESILGEVTEAVSFQLIGENAADRLEKTYGLQAADIERLPAGHWIARNMRGGAFLRGRLW